MPKQSEGLAGQVDLDQISNSLSGGPAGFRAMEHEGKVFTHTVAGGLKDASGKPAPTYGGVVSDAVRPGGLNGTIGPKPVEPEPKPISKPKRWSPNGRGPKSGMKNSTNIRPLWTMKPAIKEMRPLTPKFWSENE
jgi:hypothetical protein